MKSKTQTTGMMKALIFALFAFISFNLFSQEIHSGVFVSPQDYKENKLSYGNPCGKGNKIKFNEFLDKPYITIKHQGAEVKLKKDSVFAIKDCNGVVHRFYKHHDSDYIIEESKSITIYGKEFSVSTSKGFKIEIEYFFSATLDGDMYPLTLENIKRQFTGNTQLIDAIDPIFPGGQGITAYDKSQKTFKVNLFLSKYIK